MAEKPYYSEGEKSQDATKVAGSVIVTVRPLSIHDVVVMDPNPWADAIREIRINSRMDKNADAKISQIRVIRSLTDAHQKTQTNP